MQHHHVLSKDDIKTDTITVHALNLAPDIHAWFEMHSDQSVSIHAADGSVLRQNALVSRIKKGEWKISCGFNIFCNAVPNDKLVIQFLEHDRLEIDVQPPALDAQQMSFLPHQPVDFNDSAFKPQQLFPVNRKLSNGILGEQLNFRGLQHAPVNEQGVVFLFGMICQELGYLIEVVRSEFPDCEGKRLISQNPQLWQRVSIEFEYQSYNFRRHKHDPDGCDLIVCWEDNWKQCPLEVLELRTEIAKLGQDSGK